MYIYHALTNALSTHMTHINLNMIFYTHVEHSPTKTIYIKYCKKKRRKKEELFHSSVSYSNIPFSPTNPLWKIFTATPFRTKRQARSLSHHFWRPIKKHDPLIPMQFLPRCNMLYLFPNNYSSVLQALAFPTPPKLAFSPLSWRSLATPSDLNNQYSLCQACKMWWQCFKLESFQDFLNTNKAPAKSTPQTPWVAPLTSAVWMTSLSTTSWSTASSTLRYMPTARWPRFSVCSRSSKKEGQRDG